MILYKLSLIYISSNVTQICGLIKLQILISFLALSTLPSGTLARPAGDDDPFESSYLLPNNLGLYPGQSSSIWGDGGPPEGYASFGHPGSSYPGSSISVVRSRLSERKSSGERRKRDKLLKKKYG
jgi:hypothetical protein